ncbi:MAG: hypothetical protein WDO06_07440 [Actinomycetota bacterium]
MGLPEGFDAINSSSLGLQIVRTLTENELLGELSLRSDQEGTTVSVNFPISGATNSN